MLLTLFLISYATGYRITNTLDFTHTGGFYISSTLSGSDIFVADKFITKTSLFQRNVLVQNLRLGSYDISVSKDGYQTWKKSLVVYPEKITEVHPFTMKSSPELNRIFPFFVQGEGASSTILVGTTTKGRQLNSEYANVKALFATTTSNTSVITVQSATSTTRTLRKIVVTEEKGALRVSWNGDIQDEPYYFCQNEVCQNTIVMNIRERVLNFDFFPGRDDILVVSLPSGLYAVEIDSRSSQNMQSIVEEKDIDFRIEKNGTIYIKKASSFFSVAL